MPFADGYPFDPSYGYSLDALLAVEPPAAPADFAAWWRSRYARALAVAPNPRLRRSGEAHPRWRVHDLDYESTDAFPIRGWLLTPRDGRRGAASCSGTGTAASSARRSICPATTASIWCPASAA
jgi:cephalosporin-C deacetylase